jgi:hypothetical protein
MRKLIAVAILGMGISVVHAQSASSQSASNGTIPADQVAQIRTAVAASKAAQLAAIKAQQQAITAQQQANNVIQLVKAAMELDESWDFNPHYNDAKSADYRVLKFVQRAAPPPPPPAAEQTGPAK